MSDTEIRPMSLTATPGTEIWLSSTASLAARSTRSLVWHKAVHPAEDAVNTLCGPHKIVPTYNPHAGGWAPKYVEGIELFPGFEMGAVRGRGWNARPGEVCGGKQPSHGYCRSSDKNPQCRGWRTWTDDSDRTRTAQLLDKKSRKKRDVIMLGDNEATFPQTSLVPDRDFVEFLQASCRSSSSPSSSIPCLPRPNDSPALSDTGDNSSDNSLPYIDTDDEQEDSIQNPIQPHWSSDYTTGAAPHNASFHGKYPSSSSSSAGTQSPSSSSSATLSSDRPRLRTIATPAQMTQLQPFTEYAPRSTAATTPCRKRSNSAAQAAVDAYDQLEFAYELQPMRYHLDGELLRIKPVERVAMTVDEKTGRVGWFVKTT